MSSPFAATPPTIEKPTVLEDESKPLEAPVEAPTELVEDAREEIPVDPDTFLDEEEVEAAPEVKRIEKPTPAIPVAPPPLPTKDDVTVDVEKILEAGLGDLYQKLPDATRPLFKKKGEEAASEISGMVRRLQIQAKRVLELIRNWLLVIPGVNKFFLEQEAKIKTDQLIELVKTRKEDQHKTP